MSGGSPGLSHETTTDQGPGGAAPSLTAAGGLVANEPRTGLLKQADTDAGKRSGISSIPGYFAAGRKGGHRAVPGRVVNAAAVGYTVQGASQIR